MFYTCHYYLQGQISRNEAERSKQIHIFLELEHLFGAEADGTRMGPILALQLGHPQPLFLTAGKPTLCWIPSTTLKERPFPSTLMNPEISHFKTIATQLVGKML